MGREGHRYRTNGSVAIYALCEPDGEVRYVGKTAHYLHVRHKAHIRSALEARLKMGAARRAGATFPCQVCGTTFWRKPRDIKKGHNKFCSVDCSNGRFRGPRLPL